MRGSFDLGGDIINDEEEHIFVSRNKDNDEIADILKGISRATTSNDQATIHSLLEQVEQYRKDNKELRLKVTKAEIVASAREEEISRLSTEVNMLTKKLVIKNMLLAWDDDQQPHYQEEKEEGDDDDNNNNEEPMAWEVFKFIKFFVETILSHPLECEPGFLEKLKNALAFLCALEEEEKGQNLNIKKLLGTFGETGVLELTKMSVNGLIQGALDVVKDNTELQHVIQDLRGIISKGRKAINEVVDKNNMLVKKYDELVSYSKNNDGLITSLFDVKDKLETAVKELISSEEDSCRQIENAQVVMESLKNRNKEISRWLEKSRHSEEQARQESSRVIKNNGIYMGLIEEYTQKISKLQKQVVDLQKRVVAPSALLRVSDIEEEMNLERNFVRKKLKELTEQHNSRSPSDIVDTLPEAEITSQNINCDRCIDMFLVMKHYQETLNTSQYRISALQEKFESDVSSVKNDHKRKGQSLEEEYKKKEAILSEKVISIKSKNSKLNEKLKSSEEQLKAQQKASDAKTKAKNEEIQDLNNEISKLSKLLKDEQNRKTLKQSTGGGGGGGGVVAVANDKDGFESSCGRFSFLFFVANCKSILNRYREQNTGKEKPIPELAIISEIVSLADKIDKCHFIEEHGVSDEEKITRRNSWYKELSYILSRNAPGIMSLVEQQQQWSQSVTNKEAEDAIVTEESRQEQKGDSQWQKLFLAVRDVLPCLVDMLAIVSKGRWRMNTDCKYLKEKEESLKSVLDELNTQIQQRNSPSCISDLSTRLNQILFSPVPGNTRVPFLKWFMEHVGSCTLINEFFAKSMADDLSKYKKIAEDIKVMNQNMVKNIENLLLAFSSPPKSGSSSSGNGNNNKDDIIIVDLFNLHSSMLTQFEKIVEEADVNLSSLVSNPSLDNKIKGAINNYQVAWKFLFGVCKKFSFRGVAGQREEKKEEEENFVGTESPAKKRKDDSYGGGGGGSNIVPFANGFPDNMWE